MPADDWEKFIFLLACTFSSKEDHLPREITEQNKKLFEINF